MRNRDIHDTIVAIATAIGESGIGIVRMSGQDALAIADKIFLSKDGKKPSSFKTYTVHYGWIVDSFSSSQVLKFSKASQRTNELTNQRTKIIDEVILTVMRAPRSYTKEDVVEINCHGGILAMRAVLELVLAHGARLAEPGEFTRRAFLNGRIDLTQAEAVLDIIKAKTDSALRIGSEQLRGVFSQEIRAFKKTLLDILAGLEANIDFPDDQIAPVDLIQVREKLSDVYRKLKVILETSRCGRILREGIHTVICGKPNVGKSSLLNALLRQERSIVTPVAGTTRDTIEEIIDIKGIPVRIVDTAGIIEPKDPVEKKAVLRSKRYIRLADLIILVFDGSKRLTKEDEMLIRRLAARPTIAVINKIDLRQKISRGPLRKKFKHIIDISAKKPMNIPLLEEAIVSAVYSGRASVCEPLLVSNRRHIEILRRAEKLIEEGMNSLDNKLSLEFVAQDLKDALLCLDELLGEKFSEDLLGRIFSEFCIGK